MRRVLGPVLASLCCVTGGQAIAQAQSQQAPASDIARPGELSDKLKGSSGVIHPQDGIDPDMTKTPQTGGRMPVIPPPGSAGGSSDVSPR